VSDLLIVLRAEPRTTPKCLTSTFPNKYYTIGLRPHSHTSFINLGISSIHSLISSKVTRSHSCSITLRNSSTDRTERPRFRIVPGGASEEDGIDNSISGVCRHTLRRFRGCSSAIVVNCTVGKEKNQRCVGNWRAKLRTINKSDT
jgi:hypothetical protein